MTSSEVNIPAGLPNISSTYQPLSLDLVLTEDEVQRISGSANTMLKPLRQIKVVRDGRRTPAKTFISETILHSPGVLSSNTESLSLQPKLSKPREEHLQRPKTAASSSGHVSGDSTPNPLIVRNGSYRFIHGYVKLLGDILQYNGFSNSFNNANKLQGQSQRDIDLIWCCHHLRGQSLLNLPPFRKINLFPHSYECTRKDALARNINLLIQIHGVRHFSFMPECYVWPQERDLLEKAMTRPTSATNSRYFNHNSSNSFPYPWIIKPASSCQGKGIHIVTDYREIEGRISEDELHIVERYIQNPLLLNQKKFDLRIYVLVTSFNPLKIYVHREGLVRRASEIYDYGCDGFHNKYSHLTNYSINKSNVGSKIGSKSEENGGCDGQAPDCFGLKLSFQELNDWIKENGCEDPGNLKVTHCFDCLANINIWSAFDC
jgi:hypothetical protein